MIAVAEFLISFAFITLASLCAWQSLRGLGRALDVLSFLLLHAFCTSVLVLAAGLIGILTAHGLAGLSGAGLVLLARARRSELKQAAGAATALLWDLGRAFRRRPCHTVGLSVVVSALALRMALHIIFLPPYVWDVLTYHLPKVAEWVQRGSLHVPSLPVDRVYWPGGFELLQTWWAVFPHNDFWVEIPGLYFYLIAIVAVGSVARRLGLSRVASAWCATAFATTPVLLLNAVSCKNDIAVSALILHLAALWCRPVPASAARRRWWLSFLILCLGVGIKPTLLFALPGLLVVASLGLRATDLRDIAQFRLSPRAVQALALGLTLAGFWYLRNWVRFGNPFHPVVMGIIGGYQPQQGGFSLTTLARALGDIFRTKILDGNLGNHDVPMATGWGWLVFACGWPAVLPAALTSRAFRRIATGLAVSSVVTLGMVNPSPWNMRYMAWAAALPLWGFFLLWRSPVLVRPVRAGLAIMAVLAGTLNMAATLGGVHSARDWRYYLKNPGAPHARVALLQRHWNARAPLTEPVAVSLGGDDWLYLLYNRDFSRRLVHLPANAPGAFADAMRAQGLRYLLCSPWSPPSDWPEALVADQEAGRLERLVVGLYALPGVTTTSAAAKSSAEEAAAP